MPVSILSTPSLLFGAQSIRSLSPSVMPLCENGVGMFNQTRNTLFLYLEAAGEYRRITPEDYDVNHVYRR